MEVKLQRIMAKILHLRNLQKENEQAALQSKGHGHIHELQEQYLSQHIFWRVMSTALDVCLINQDYYFNYLIVRLLKEQLLLDLYLTKCT